MRALKFFMRVSLWKSICVLAIGMLFVEKYAFVFAETPTPSIPETSAASEEATSSPEVSPPHPKTLLAELTRGDDYPVELIIPSIKLDYRVLQVGVNEKGEMDVPNGNTKDVGWYEGGTIPGNMGSAVIDAHVFAAFKNLRYVKVGDDIYVVTRSGKKLHFRAEESLVYKTPQVPAEVLFNRSDARRLNLITCAGKYIPRLETYDHRLIVYAVLVDE